MIAGKQFTWDIKVHQMGKTRNESAWFFIGESCFIFKSIEMGWKYVMNIMTMKVGITCALTV